MDDQTTAPIEPTSTTPEPATGPTLIPAPEVVGESVPAIELPTTEETPAPVETPAQTIEAEPALVPEAVTMPEPTAEPVSTPAPTPAPESVPAVGEKVVEKIVEKEVVKEVIKEVIKEVVKEVPVEKIVERIVEKPVEVEKIVEKIVYRNPEPTTCPPPTEEEREAIHRDFLIDLSKEGTAKKHELMLEKMAHIMRLFDAETSIAHKDVMEALDCSGTTATRLLTELRHEGKVVLHGSSPHTYTYTKSGG